MKPYGLDKKRVRWIHCYCKLCFRGKGHHVSKGRERQSAIRQIKEDLREDWLSRGER